MSAHNSQDPTLWPPGTVIIEDQNGKIPLYSKN